jgi:hypothetical protein
MTPKAKGFLFGLYAGALGGLILGMNVEKAVLKPVKKQEKNAAAAKAAPAQAPSTPIAVSSGPTMTFTPNNLTWSNNTTTLVTVGSGSVYGSGYSTESYEIPNGKGGFKQVSKEEFDDVASAFEEIEARDAKHARKGTKL